MNAFRISSNATLLKVGGFNVRDRPLQMSKTDDILHGPAQSVGLRIVRNATLPSGKRVPLRPPPISAFSSEPYEDPKDFTADLRPGEVLCSFTKIVVLTRAILKMTKSLFLRKGPTANR